MSVREFYDRRYRHTKGDGSRAAIRVAVDDAGDMRWLADKVDLEFRPRPEDRAEIARLLARDPPQPEAERVELPWAITDQRGDTMTVSRERVVVVTSGGSSWLNAWVTAEQHEQAAAAHIEAARQQREREQTKAAPMSSRCLADARYAIKQSEQRGEAVPHVLHALRALLQHAEQQKAGR